MKHKEGARRVVSVFAAFLLATMGLTAVATAGPLSAVATETDPDKLAVEDVVVDEEAEFAESASAENAVLSGEEDVVSDSTTPSDMVEPAEGADVAGMTSTTTDPAEGAVDTEADEIYLIWLRLDTSGGATDSAIEAQLGMSIEENLKLASEDPDFHDIIPSWATSCSMAMDAITASVAGKAPLT